MVDPELLKNMAADVGTSYKEKYKSRLEPLDGDRAFLAYQAWNSDFTVPRDEYDRRQFKWLGPVPQEIFPTTIRFVKGNRLFDWNAYTDFRPAISTRLKDAIEAIEPGVHQFMPVEVLHKDGSSYSETFWFFFIGTLIDAISDAKDGVYKGAWADLMKDPEAFFWTIKSGARDRLAVHKEKITGRAMWCDRHYPTGAFFSDALIEVMRAEGMEGWDIVSYWEEI